MRSGVRDLARGFGALEEAHSFTGCQTIWCTTRNIEESVKSRRILSFQLCPLGTKRRRGFPETNMRLPRTLRSIDVYRMKEVPAEMYSYICSSQVVQSTG